MKLPIGFIVICATLYAGATNRCPENTNAILETPPRDGFLASMQEMLLAKFGFINSKLLEVQVELIEQREEAARNRGFNEKTFEDVLWALHRLEQDVGRNFSVLQDRSLVILDQQTSCANHERLRERLFGDAPKQNQSSSYKPLERILLAYKSQIPDCSTPKSPPPPMESTTATTAIEQTTTIPKLEKNPITSCKDVPYNKSGVYLFRVYNDSLPFTVYCEQEKFGGGWLVVQYRFNGSVDFYRNWDQYRDGFGDLDGEFWFGLEKMHQLTTSRNYELMVEIKDFSGKYGYARYSAFQIGSESEQYSLKILGSYSGNATDSLTIHNKESKFSTKDRDNDKSSSLHCAQNREGAWWYGECTYANLNGLYKNVIDQKSMYWYYFKNDFHGLSYSRMMIREL